MLIDAMNAGGTLEDAQRFAREAENAGLDGLWITEGGRTPFLAPDTYTLITGESDFHMGSVLSVVLIAPCIVIFLAHRRLMEGRTHATIGGKPVAAEPRRMSLLIKLPFATIAIAAAGAILVCFGVVLVASFYKILGVTPRMTLANYLDFTSNQAIYNSIRVSLVAAVIGACPSPQYSRQCTV